MLLFGNRHKLELLTALAHASDGRVNLSELAAEQQVAPSVYYPPIRDLLQAGLVEMLPRTLPDRRRWYRRVEGKVWKSMRSFTAELATIEVKVS